MKTNKQVGKKVKHNEIFSIAFALKYYNMLQEKTLVMESQLYPNTTAQTKVFVKVFWQQNTTIITIKSFPLFCIDLLTCSVL